MAGGRAGLVAKLDAGGNPAWSKTWGSAAGSVSVTSVAVDTAGDVVVTGGLSGSVDLGGGVLIAPGTETDTFTAKLDTMGNHLWSKRFADGAEAGNGGPRVAVDSSGNVWLTGTMAGTTDFGEGSLTSKGGDVFIAKLTSTGGYLGAKIFGDGQEQEGRDIVTDSAGNAIVVGKFSGSIDFGAGPLSAGMGGFDIFVAKFAP